MSACLLNFNQVFKALPGFPKILKISHFDPNSKESCSCPQQTTHTCISIWWEDRDYSCNFLWCDFSSKGNFVLTHLSLYLIDVSNLSWLYHNMIPWIHIQYFRTLLPHTFWKRKFNFFSSNFNCKNAFEIYFPAHSNYVSLYLLNLRSSMLLEYSSNFNYALFWAYFDSNSKGHIEVSNQPYLRSLSFLYQFAEEIFKI